MNRLQPVASSPSLIGSTVVVLLLLLVVSPPSRAHARAEHAPDCAEQVGRLDGPFVRVEGHLSILNDAADRALLAGAFGYGVRGGYRWSGWGVFLVFEHDLWLGLEKDPTVQIGVVNLGVGGEFVYARGFVRSAIAAGPSVLIEDTALDSAGTTGFFVDIRPVGLRFDVHPHLVIGLDPLTFSLIAPVLGGIPLIQVEYRTAFFLEATW